MLYEGLIQRANFRAQRRFRAMVRAFFASGSWLTREADLYLESDALVVALEDRGLTEKEPPPDATIHSEVHREFPEPATCGICRADEEFFLRWGYQRPPESELRALYGDR